MDAAHFRSRAKHCRELAKDARDDLSRKELNDIAAELDAEADRIEAEQAAEAKQQQMKLPPQT